MMMIDGRMRLMAGGSGRIYKMLGWVVINLVARVMHRLARSQLIAGSQSINQGRLQTLRRLSLVVTGATGLRLVSLCTAVRAGLGLRLWLLNSQSGCATTRASLTTVSENCLIRDGAPTLEGFRLEVLWLVHRRRRRLLGLDVLDWALLAFSSIEMGIRRVL